MASSKLSVRKVQTATPGKYTDGDGLHLEVRSTGLRKWKYRYTINGRRREMHVGTYPYMSLAEARETRDEHRKTVRQGIDPIELRANPPAVPEQAPRFTSCAAGFIRSKRRGWKNRKHARQWVATLKTYARPIIGDTPVDEITTDDIERVLLPIWHSKTETAKRVQTRIENVLDYAAAKKMRDPMNPARWRGHLDKILPRPTAVTSVQNHPSMPFTDVPAFMAELAGQEGTAPLALRWLILTATRTSEVLGARWDEIDGDVWTIPAERMKAKREHRVPLPPQALQLLTLLPQVARNPYLFPGKIDRKPLSNMALLKVMRGLGFGGKGQRGPFVPHGFRSSFRDWSGESTNYPRDVCEMALAHTVKDKVEAAYRRGDLFLKRRAMMADWSRFITSTGLVDVPILARSEQRAS